MPRESVEDGNNQLDGDQTLDILLGFAMVHVSKSAQSSQDLKEQTAQANEILFHNENILVPLLKVGSKSGGAGKG